MKVKKLTTRLSSDSKPTLGYVIPYFNKIIDLFEEPQHEITDEDFKLSLGDITLSIERFMMQHFNDAEQVVEGEQALSTEDWMMDIDNLNRHYNANRTPTPTISAAQRSSPPGGSPPDSNTLSAIYGAAEPMFATVTYHSGSAEPAAKQILAAAVKAGYVTLMKHYNNIVSVGILASALDPRFNLEYYKLKGHGDLITDSYIPLCIIPLCFIVFDCLLTLYMFIDRIEIVHYQYMMRYLKDNPQPSSRSHTSPVQVEESNYNIFMA